MRFHLIQVNTFCCEGGQNWNRFPREVVGSPLGDLFKIQPDMVLDNLL